MAELKKKSARGAMAKPSSTRLPSARRTPVFPHIARVLLVSDDREARRCLEALLAGWPDLRCVGSASDGVAALELLGRSRPDLLLIDLGRPVTGGIECLVKSRAANPGLVCVVLAGAGDVSIVRRALEAGAAGCWSKPATREEFRFLIEQAMLGNAPIHPVLTRALFNFAPARGNLLDSARGPLLASREHTLMRLAADGLSYKEMAGKLNLSLATVKNGFHSIYCKMRVHNRVEAVLKWRDGG